MEATKLFLESQRAPEAVAALKAIRQSESAGDFEAFSPTSHLAHFRTMARDAKRMNSAT
jgi:hypothetical protein